MTIPGDPSYPPGWVEPAPPPATLLPGEEHAADGGVVGISSRNPAGRPPSDHIPREEAEESTSEESAADRE